MDKEALKILLVLAVISLIVLVLPPGSMGWVLFAILMWMCSAILAYAVASSKRGGQRNGRKGG